MVNNLTMPGRVTAVALLPDGRLAIGMEDGTIKLWNVQTGKCEATLEEHSDRVTALVLLPDGWLASGSWDHTIRLWDVQTGECKAILEGHSKRVTALALW